MLEERYFAYFRNLLYSKTGINLTETKDNLLQIKLERIMRRKHINSYHEYYKLLKNESDNAELQEFINVFTTNTTEFFREPIHFDYIKDNMDLILNTMPDILKKNEIRVWCTASSTGQEPVTLAMVLREFLPERVEVRMLATDISSKVLTKAAAGFYTFNEIDGIPKYYLYKYFTQVENGYILHNQLLNTIKYRYYNLMENFKFNHNFNIIFCRNVMIYFDHVTQQNLIRKIYQNLTKGGLLFIGNSESLHNKNQNFTNIGPSIYKK